MSKKKRLPVIQAEQHKDVRQTPVVDGFCLPMGWNFHGMETSKECPWRCTFTLLNRYRNRLLSFEGKSFQQIEAEKGSSHAWPDISRLCKEFRALIYQRNLDAEALWQLELDGKARLFGIREHNIFHVIWLDIEHRAYPVMIRHT